MTPDYEHIHKTFVDKARMLSTNINDYLASQLYLSDVEDEDMITDEIIFNLIVGMVVDELRHMGVAIEVSDIYNDRTMLMVTLHVREMFSIETLTEIFSSNDSLRESVAMFIDGSEYDEELLLSELIAIMHVRHPLSTKWEFLNIHKDLIACTYRFKEHVVSIMDTADKVSNDDATDDAMLQYTQVLSVHVEDIMEYVNILAINFDLVVDDNTWLSYAVEDHDHRLINILDPGEMLIYLDSSDPHPAHTMGKDVASICSHKQQSIHHLEYYNASNSPAMHRIVNLPTIILLSADMYRPQWTLEKNLSWVKEHCKAFTIVTETILNSIVQCITILSQQVDNNE